MMSWRCVLLVVISVFLMVQAEVGAQELQGPEIGARELKGGDSPVLITADELSQDQELGTIIARGNVEISQGDRILMADSVSYNEKSDTVSASGNVTLLEPSGEVIFAEYVELTDELKNGIVKQLRILLTDDSRFAASEASRRDGNRTIMKRAIYSPCLPCKEDPSKSLVWQIKAQKVEHDQERREIRYTNAFLEMFGVPVAYVPYFSHPDPTVKRKSGFLAPDFGTGGNFGGFVRVPYYIVLDKDKDATVTPIYTGDDGLIFSGEYRQRFDKGEIKLLGSVTEADRETTENGQEVIRRDQIRGHVNFKGRYDFDDTWRAGADIERASDRTYLRRFNFFEKSGDTLDSNVFVEGFRPRTYAAANFYSFQDTRPNETEDQPLIAPLMQYDHISDADRFGGRFSINSDFRFLHRDDGPTTERLGFRPGYKVSRTTDSGVVATFEASLRASVYNVNQTENPTVSPQSETSVTGRILPRATVDFRYPLVRASGKVRQVIEPIVMFTATPNGSNPNDIPDEDSTVFEADDTNLFSPDRLPGVDRVESGQRVAYGVNLGVYGTGNGRTTAFVGHSYRLRADDSLNRENLIERHSSNIVGRIEVVPNKYTNVYYRFAFAPDKLFDPARNEVTFSLGPAAYKLSGSYSFVGATPQFDEREELRLRFRSQITDYWSVEASTHQDLAANQSLRNS
ncbi:MAG: LPS assembly protein LptD, partial [Alphaproteobacteria bacterium]|nr:LPS assembly protein LptD [Alphaproteobacteria bacterium]